jgi:predicted CXXCH cytochrome family protein
MTCTVCHNPHTAELKTVEGLEVQGPSGLCINCHRDYMTDFPYSNHSQSGVKCVDCHLHNFGANGDRDIHTMPDHGFSANLAACSACHADQMHGATAAAALNLLATATPEPVMEQDASLESQPAPVSPYGFAGLAGLLGLAGGVVLAPWLDKAYRKLNKGK